MPSDFYKKATKLIDKYKSEAYFIGKRDNSIISKAEESLGFFLPPSYLLFVSNYGAGSFCGEEFYGITNENFENSSIPNAVWLTLNSRKKYNLPDELILIMGLDDGSYYAISTNKEDKEIEGWVVLWSPIDEDISIIDNSFGEFFFRRINEALD
ncbi:SMI1/KNR4 family protein [Motilimonas pumila]|uniref:SMI1/KNR4 family protein n=1 Tax=Motilimonas pumila TaxID=2303987 RepID=A0A418Y983_9GAMM|nr:SMI1/KNR4 family protein [Motilimonas pumila]RJG36790.1 SMI1/KNR4 family protein [Motilimonas pumila]